MEIEVGKYRLVASSGRHIRMATFVVLDGRRVNFIERLPKRVAIANARYQLEGDGPVNFDAPNDDEDVRFD